MLWNGLDTWQFPEVQRGTLLAFAVSPSPGLVLSDAVEHQGILCFLGSVFFVQVRAQHNGRLPVTLVNSLSGVTQFGRVSMGDLGSSHLWLWHPRSLCISSQVAGEEGVRRSTHWRFLCVLHAAQSTSAHIPLGGAQTHGTEETRVEGVATVFLFRSCCNRRERSGMKVGSTPRTNADLEPGSRVGQWVENS